MKQSPKVRRRISFTPIMLSTSYNHSASKSIRPINRGDYESSRNELRINKIRKNRNDLTELLMKEQEYESNKLFFEREVPEGQHVFQGFQEESQEESYRKLVRKMTTPTVVKVEFQKELIRHRKRAEMQLKQLHGESAEEVRSDLSKALYYTNAKTFEEFTKLNKIKPSKKHAPEEQTDEQWKRYLNKYYLSIRKVKPLMKRDEGIRLLSPKKIGLISNMQHIHQQVGESKEVFDKLKPPFRSYSKNESRHSTKRQHICDTSKKDLPEEVMNLAILKKIDQDISLRKTQNKKDFFVFGLSQSSGKSGQSPQLKVKMENYWDFLFRINFTNGLYACAREQDKTVKCFVGFGNNSALIKGILRRRFWWQMTDKIEEASFVWTQLKMSQITRSQNKSQVKLTLLQKRHRDEYNLGQKVEDIEMANRAIMTGNDLRMWQKYYQSNAKHEDKGLLNVLSRRSGALLKFKKIDLIEANNRIKVHNHLQCNYFLGNKKALFYSMKKYYELNQQDPFTKIPLTFHITEGLEDPEFQHFLTVFQGINEQRKEQKDLRNIWIVKPGELTNRGRGITVCSTLDEIKIRLKSKQKNGNGTIRTFIIQKYLQKPLLYQKRKFDIRHYMAITSVNGRIKGYWYADGYIRTTSCEYSIKNTKDLFTHLTNDAVQKNGQDYGKFQKGNKVSYNQFKKYLAHHYGPQADFYGKIMPKMKQLAADTIRATYNRLDPERRQHNFQIFGLDFMLDQNMNVFLIEVNTNPCLEQSCPLQTKILIPMIDNLFKYSTILRRICLDPIFPPPAEWPPQKRYFLGDNALEENKFTIIFDQSQEGHELRSLYRDDHLDERMGDIFEEQQEYNDEQKEWNEDEEPGKK